MGLSFGHLIVILFIVLLIFGPSRLEGIGTSLGKAIRGFKKGLDEEDEIGKKPSDPTSSTGSDKKIT